MTGGMIALACVVLWLTVVIVWGMAIRDKRMAPVAERLDATDRIAIRRFPDHASIMAALCYRDPCGCWHDWATGPPSVFSCDHHLFGGHLGGIPPDVMLAWRAREILKRRGQFHPATHDTTERTNP